MINEEPMITILYDAPMFGPIKFDGKAMVYKDGIAIPVTGCPKCFCLWTNTPDDPLPAACDCGYQFTDDDKRGTTPDE
jgi:hypothetical protein